MCREKLTNVDQWARVIADAFFYEHASTVDETKRKEKNVREDRLKEVQESL